MEGLDEVATRCRQVQEYFNECYSLLPGYNARSLQGRISSLKGVVAGKREKMAPKKKFAFSRKNRKKNADVESKKGL